YDCLTGIARRRPELVAGGLAMMLAGKYQKDDMDDAISLVAHGLYRICECVSPDLVAAFDVGSPGPWDTEVHALCQSPQNPVEGLDLTSVAPELHDMIVLGKVPEWLKPVPQELYELVLLGGDAKQRDLLELIGRCAGTRGGPRGAKQVLECYPVVLCWNMPKH